MMGLIFWFSSQQGSDSSETSGKIVAIIQKLSVIIRGHDFSPANLDIVTKLVRKCAHFSEYALFGWCTVFALTELFRSKWVACIFSELFVFLYAVSDEVHQFFVPGRSMSPLDVAIDSLGALLGIWIYIIFKREHKRKKKPGKR